MAATLFEADGPVPRERLDFAIEELRAYVARVGFQTRLAFDAAFFVMQVAPLFVFGKLRRFTSLSTLARRRCIERLEQSRLGLVVVLLKTMLSMVYFEHPDALAGTGYDAEGLIGPAWAQGSTSPLSKLKLQVIETPVSDEPEQLPVPAAGRVAGGV
ncbi:hypothetical protein AKJ08_0109 [Vulgatibacter incomptus]|uniref:Uncharacterized protein n=2 Tax=Vulgatibacter incomptus TaxID=1391653 RepID=A0A0K1P8A3_9BACT|nr:hypothetical protein AKJ08_0109 [Vulgatibacter incomptus]